GIAGVDVLALQQDGARAALANPAAVARALELQVVAQDVEQRGVAFGRHVAGLAVDPERVAFWHGRVLRGGIVGRVSTIVLSPGPEDAEDGKGAAPWSAAPFGSSAAIAAVATGYALLGECCGGRCDRPPWRYRGPEAPMQRAKSAQTLKA